METQAESGAPRQTVQDHMEATKNRVFELEIARLAGLSVLDYERQRKDMAKALGIRPAILDTLVEEARQKAKEAAQLPFTQVEPWPEPVDAAALLDEIEAAIRRFIICVSHVYVAATLWVAVTWFLAVVRVAPIAMITAPEKGCGKTQLLAILALLSRRAMTVSNITASALFRAIELWRPTLFIDEADNILTPKNPELCSVINAGDTLDSAYVLRTVGEEHTPRRFGTYGPKALAGIKVEKKVPTITDRSIVMPMRKRLKTEKVERLRRADPKLFPALAAKLARFAQDAAEEVRDAQAEVPELDALSDRQMDRWEPLLAIAQVAGGAWPAKAIAAALALSGVEDEDSGPGPELLANIREVFREQENSPFAPSDRMTTDDLIKALCANEEWRWATYDHGRAISPRQVVSLLKPYGIRSRSIRIGDKTPKGYLLEDFRDAFARYLSFSSLTPEKCRNMQQHNENNELYEVLPATENRDNQLNSQDCCVLRQKSPPNGSTKKNGDDLPPIEPGPDGIGAMTF